MILCPAPPASDYGGAAAALLTSDHTERKAGGNGVLIDEAMPTKTTTAERDGAIRPTSHENHLQDPTVEDRAPTKGTTLLTREGGVGLDTV